MFKWVSFVMLAMIPVIQPKVLDDDMLLFWRRSETQNTCKPFTTYQENCNKCVCSADGVSYCTKMACFRPRLISQVEPNILPLEAINQVDGNREAA